MGGVVSGMESHQRALVRFQGYRRQRLEIGCNTARVGQWDGIQQGVRAIAVLLLHSSMRQWPRGAATPAVTNQYQQARATASVVLYCQPNSAFTSCMIRT